MNSVRFVDADEGTIEGPMIPFSGPFPGGKDLHGTRFSPDTDYALDWFESRPLLFHHGLDDGPGIAPVGRISDLSIREGVGVWAKAQLDKNSDYFDDISKLIDEEALYWSHATMEHLLKADRSGNILQWPIVEGTLTPTPSNPMAIPLKSFRAAIRSAGLEDFDDALEEHVEDDATLITPEEFEAARATLKAKDRKALLDSDFAYIDSKGNRNLPINDESHVKAAMARFNQQEFDSADDKPKAWRKIMARAKKFGIDVKDTKMPGRSAPWVPVRAKVADDAVPYEKSFEDIKEDIEDQLNPGSPFAEGYSPCYSYVVATYDEFVIICRQEDGDSTFWRVAYTLDSDDEPVLGESNEVEKVFIPVARSILPITSEAQTLSRRAVALAERTKDLSERRAAEGRAFSTSNRVAVAKAAGQLDEAKIALSDVVARVDAAAAEAARAALWSTPDARRQELEVFELEMALL